jgi:membrane protein YdbS with pleckstrin-like domain
MPISDDQPAPDLQPVAEPLPVPKVAPSIADGSERRLEPKTIQAERISGGIFATVLTGVSFVGMVLVVSLGSPGLIGGLALLGGWLVISGTVTGLILWWPAVRYRRISYQVSEQGIRIRRGVVWRRVASVPRSRVQHTDVSQGPIERAFGLATLIIYTAGTHNASVSLGGLAHETALEIRDHLIVGGDDDAV